MASDSWLPREAEGGAGEHRPWLPVNLRVSPERLTYVVVEELIGNAVGLALSDWPEVDDEGRLCFTDAAILASVDRSWLVRELREHRRPSELAERQLRIGDVFACIDLETRSAGVESELTVTSWRPPIYDLTGEARDVAKTALYAAIAPVLTPEQASDLQVLVEDAEG